MERKASSFFNVAHFLYGVVDLHARVFASGIVEHDVTVLLVVSRGAISIHEK